MNLAAFNALPKKQQWSIAIGIPAAIAFLLMYFSYKALATLGPIDNSMDPSNKLPHFLQRDNGLGVWNQISDLQTQILAKEEIIKRGPEVAARLEGLQSDIKAAEERLPRDTEKAEMREIIERLAREIPADIGTVELKSVRISEDGGDRNATLRTITFQADLLGDADGIIKYIDLLEKNQRFMSVNSFTIHGGSIGADMVNRKVVYGLHAVHLDIVTYVYSGAKK